MFEMIATKINFSCRRIARLATVRDLVEMLIPGNRTQQYAFLVIWIGLKWSGQGIMPNLGQFVMSRGVSRRTFERVRAKMHRMGLLEHITRFDRRYGNREGWILSDKFEKSLARLAQRIVDFKSPERSSQADEERLLMAAEALRKALNQGSDEHSTAVPHSSLNRS